MDCTRLFTKARVPFYHEWSQLCHITKNDNSKIHWQNMFFWCQDESPDWKRPAIQSYAMIRGGYAAKYHSSEKIDTVRPGIGFRPAFELKENIDIPEGIAFPIAMLYIDNNALPEPTCPEAIKDYIAAHSNNPYRPPNLIFQAPTGNFLNHIHAIRIGNVAIATHTLLKNISFEHLIAQNLAQTKK